MTRIRYKRVNQEVLRSVKPVLLADGRLVDLQLVVDANGKCEYHFFDQSGDIVSTGTASTLITLKKLVKDTLITAGVKFETEKRNRTKTEVAA